MTAFFSALLFGSWSIRDKDFSETKTWSACVLFWSCHHWSQRNLCLLEFSADLATWIRFYFKKAWITNPMWREAHQTLILGKHFAKKQNKTQNFNVEITWLWTKLLRNKSLPFFSSPPLPWLPQGWLSHTVETLNCSMMHVRTQSYKKERESKEKILGEQLQQSVPVKCVFT